MSLAKRRERRRIREHVVSTNPDILCHELPDGVDHKGMCPTHSHNSMEQVDDRFMAVWPGSYKKKRVRITCPTCQRRVLARLTFCHDACCAIYLLPPHKKKGWWKKRKAGSKPRHRRFRATRRG
jgi:hypothetical protein